jgi:hypothetical protein
MPASYVPTKGIQYTPPRSLVRPRAVPSAPTTPAVPATTAVVPPPPAEAVLTKTSGVGVGAGGQGSPSIAQREATSTAGLPFRDRTVGALPALTDEDLDAYDLVNQPEESVLAALSGMGYDPASNNPAVKQLIEAAPAIQEAFLIKRVLAGGGSPTDVDRMDWSREYAEFVRDVVARGSARQVAAQAARGAGEAAQRVASLPAGENESAFMTMARGQLGTGQLPQVLSRLYAQVYTQPGEAATGQTVADQLKRLALRQQAGQPGAAAQILNFRR